MTRINTFTCDYCNPGRSADSDEGFTTTVGRDTPLGWWEVPGKGEGGTTGHACPRCALGPAGKDIAARRDAEAARIAGSMEVAT